MSIADKLKFRHGEPAHLVNAPAGIDALLEGFEWAAGNGKDITQLLFFAKEKQVIEAGLLPLLAKLKPGALLWMAYPKKSGSISSDISKDDTWDILQGYSPVALVSLNEDWSALRFKEDALIKDKKRDTPMAERVTEGINYKDRTTTLPADAKAALQQYTGLESFFENMAFTHRKEHLEAIADAKKPETRLRRITKMIDMLLAMQVAKATKSK